MIIDNTGRCGLTQHEIIDHLKINPQFDFSNLFVTDGELYKLAIADSFLDLLPIELWKDRQKIVDEDSFHYGNQAKWMMPSEYKTFDVEQYLYSLCSREEEKLRVKDELVLFKKFELLDVLRYLKYIRDIADEKSIVLGVGRGSSCASYCLFLLKIHRVDSLLYNLDISDFLRE